MKKEELIRNIKDKEDRFLVSKILDLAEKTYMKDIINVTNFLDAREKKIVIEILNREKIKYVILEPLKDADKVLICFLPSYLEKEMLDVNELYSCLKIKIKQGQKLYHKDYMGALYNLGIVEENLGDIVTLKDGAVIFVTNKVKDFLMLNITKVSKYEVDVIDVNPSEYLNLEKNFEMKNIIVKSPRIDLITAELSNLSRNKIVEKIINGEVIVNCKEEYFKSTVLKEGDILAIRKVGKFKINEFVGYTKKGNLQINVKKYVDIN